MGEGFHFYDHWLGGRQSWSPAFTLQPEHADLCLPHGFSWACLTLQSGDFFLESVSLILPPLSLRFPVHSLGAPHALGNSYSFIVPPDFLSFDSAAFARLFPFLMTQHADTHTSR